MFKLTYTYKIQKFITKTNTLTSNKMFTLIIIFFYLKKLKFSTKNTITTRKHFLLKAPFHYKMSKKILINNQSILQLSFQFEDLIIKNPLIFTKLYPTIVFKLPQNITLLKINFN